MDHQTRQRPFRIAPIGRGLSVVALLFVAASCAFSYISLGLRGVGTGQGYVQLSQPDIFPNSSCIAVDQGIPVDGDTGCDFGTFLEVGGGGILHLAATAAPGSVFNGWMCSATSSSGDCGSCSGTGICSLSFDPGDRVTFSVTARFDLEGGGGSGSPGLFLLGDSNLFRDDNMPAGSGNEWFFKNLIDFPSSLGEDVMIDCRGTGGNDAPCTSLTVDFENFRQLIDLSDIQEVTAEFASIPTDVKTFVSFVRTADFTAGEIAALKELVIRGGRVVYVTEYELFGGHSFSTTTNAFLDAMGSPAQSIGGEHDGFMVTLSGGSIGSHGVMTGVTSLVIGGASAFSPGTDDEVLFLDSTGVFPLGIETSAGP
jgi:hypothetical protein